MEWLIRIGMGENKMAVEKYLAEKTNGSDNGISEHIGVYQLEN